MDSSIVMLHISEGENTVCVLPPTFNIFALCDDGGFFIEIYHRQWSYEIYLVKDDAEDPLVIGMMSLTEKERCEIEDDIKDQVTEELTGFITKGYSTRCAFQLRGKIDEWYRRALALVNKKTAEEAAK